MAFGIGTVFDSPNNKIDGEPLLMAGYPLFESASNDDNRSLTMVKVYQIYAEDFIPLSLYLPKKGQTINYSPENTPYIVWYQVESVDIERQGSQIMRGNDVLIHVLVRIKLSMLVEPQRLEPGETPTYTDPWDLPPYNFKMGTELVEDSVQTFYNAAVDDGTGFPALQPFVNTAGVPLQAAKTRPLVRISFSFNLHTFDPRWTYSWTGSINDGPVVICGILFVAGQVKLESVNMEVCYEDREYPDVDPETGEPVTDTERVYYTRCDVVLLIDPQYDPYEPQTNPNGTGVHGWMRRYLNVGNSILRDDGLHRIWNAQTNLGYLYRVCMRLHNANEDPESDIKYVMMENSLGSQLVNAINRNTGGTETWPHILETDYFSGDDWNGTASAIGTKTVSTTVYGTAAEMMEFRNPEEVTDNMFLNIDGTAVTPIDDSGRQVPTFRTGYIEKISTFDVCAEDPITGEQVPTGTGFLYADGSVSNFIMPTAQPYIWNYEITDVQPNPGA